MAHCAERLARVHRRRMAYLLPPAGAAKLLQHASGCGKRDLCSAKRRRKHSCDRAGAATLNLAAIIRPKVGVLGSAIALPNPLFVMGKGSEEVSDLLGARALHIALAPHALCRAPQACKAHARHVEPNGSKGAGSSTVMAWESGMRGATGAEVRHRRWFDDGLPWGHARARATGCGQKRATRAGRAGGAGARLEEVLHGPGDRGSGRGG